MSDHARMNHSQPKAQLGASALPRRWPLYLGAAMLAVIAIAYFDGGEEPIRPIIQPVDLPQGSNN